MYPFESSKSDGVPFTLHILSPCGLMSINAVFNSLFIKFYAKTATGQILIKRSQNFSQMRCVEVFTSYQGYD